MASDITNTLLISFPVLGMKVAMYNSLENSTA